MKMRIVVIGLVCVVGIFFILTSKGLNSANEPGEMTTGSLPAALEQYYPPVSPAPMYLLAMLDLAKSFSSTVCDVLENDMENARLNFETFKAAYVKNSTLIPEWKEKYPLAPVEQLGAALTTGNPSRIMPAVESVGAVCHSCHLALMAPVQQKYRWDKFEDIVLTDPLSGRDVNFAELMLMMETNFEGIGNDLGQGQTAEALKQFEGFRARFEEMSEACMICHDSERLYYVSNDIVDRISDLETELLKPKINPEIVGGLLQAIGQESCSKCHLVHIPAAYNQQLMGSH